MRRLWQAVFAGAVLGSSGCHSAYVEAELVNQTKSPISVVEVDYPSASFGTQMLVPGATFHYRFKVLGSGPMKVTYTDTERHEHTAPGPDLQEGAQGPLRIVIADGRVDWQAHLSR